MTIPLAPLLVGDLVNHAHPLNRGLLAWWLAVPHLMGSVRLYDLLGVRLGTLSGPAWRGATRPGGSGHLLFDGVDDNVSVSVDVPTRHTISAWVRLDAAGSYPIVTSNVGGGECELRYQSGGAQPEYIMADGGATSSAAVTLGRWYHLTGVSAAANMLIYVDGVLAGSGSASTRNATVASVGSRANASLFFTGAIDDVAIYGRDLSAAEVRARYDLSRVGYPGVLRRAARPSTPATTVAAATFNPGFVRTQPTIGTGIY